MNEFFPPLQQSSHSMSPLRIAVVVESVVTSRYVYDFVQWARSHQSVVITHLILRPRADLKTKSRLVDFLLNAARSTKKRGLYFLISDWALQAVEKLEQAIIRR